MTFKPRESNGASKPSSQRVSVRLGEIQLVGRLDAGSAIKLGAFVHHPILHH